jgi:transposase
VRFHAGPTLPILVQAVERGPNLMADTEHLELLQKGASVLWSEGLSRHFDNRRQVAAYAGLAPTPWQSGSVNREQGISQSATRGYGQR